MLGKTNAGGWAADGLTTAEAGMSVLASMILPDRRLPYEGYYYVVQWLLAILWLVRSLPASAETIVQTIRSKIIYFRGVISHVDQLVKVVCSESWVLCMHSLSKAQRR